MFLRVQIAGGAKVDSEKLTRMHTLWHLLELCNSTAENLMKLYRWPADKLAVPRFRIGGNTYFAESTAREFACFIFVNRKDSVHI